MALKKGGLGKGLDALITNKKVQETGSSDKKPEKQDFELEKKSEIMVKISKIEPNRLQPRKNFDESSLKELSESIKQYGIIQPIIVSDKKDYYEIIAGERRWRAAKLAGLKEIPVLIKEYNPQEIVEISLIENIQREELNPIEEALAYKRLIDEFHVKHEELAEKVSKSRSVITNSMRLLKLPKEVQEFLIDGKITSGHARALLSIENSEIQIKLAEKIIDEGLNVRQVETLTKKMAEDSEKTEKLNKSKKDTTVETLIYHDIEEKLKQIIGTKVSIIRKKNNKGKIEIEYYSENDLERITELIESLG